MELIENFLEYFKLRGDKTLKEFGVRSDTWWIKMWFKLVLLFGILIADAELKIHGHSSLVSYATLVIPLFALLLLGNPMRQVQFSTIWALFVHKEKTDSLKDKLSEGFKTYWTVVGIVLLWAFFIPLGIKIVPIEYSPAAFWTFLPAIAAHELAWWRGWHNDQERDFRRYSITGLKWVIYACILLPFLFAAKGAIYEQYGYAVPIPSTSNAAINRATHENEVLLEAKRTECVSKITEQSVKKGVPLTKKDVAAMERCKTLYPSATLPDSSQKEGGGNILGDHSLLGMGLWAIVWGHILWFVGAAILAGLGWRFWKKSDDVASTKTVEVKKTSSSSSIRPTAAILYLGVFYALASWYNGGWITSDADVSHLSGKISRIFEQRENEKIKAYPNAFLTPEEVKTWEAVGTSPAYHPNFGEIAGHSFEIITGARSGVRPNLYDRLAGGYGKPLIIMLEEDNTARDVVLENTTCNPPKIYSDNNVHTVCVGKWRSGDRKIGGVSELDYSADTRIAVLHSAKPNGEIGVITFVFRKK